jgi:hypothetical protein
MLAVALVHMEVGQVALAVVEILKLLEQQTQVAAAVAVKAIIQQVAQAVLA